VVGLSKRISNSAWLAVYSLMTTMVQLMVLPEAETIGMTRRLVAI
jgi:hypothetical protein